VVSWHPEQKKNQGWKWMQKTVQSVIWFPFQQDKES
jgi:hypothetical protein